MSNGIVNLGALKPLKGFIGRNLDLGVQCLEYLDRYIAASDDGKEENLNLLFIHISKLLLEAEIQWTEHHQAHLSKSLEELCRLVLERLKTNSAPLQSHLDFYDVLVRIKRLQNKKNRTIENRKALVRAIEQRLAIKEQMGLDTQFDAISISVMSREIKRDMQ